MENRLQATFMPRQSSVTGDAYVRPKGPPNFLMLIGVIIFVLTLAIFGGLYFYQGYLNESNASKKAEVQDAINNFEPELTKELTLLKARVDAGKSLLSNHSAVSTLFSLIGVNTAQTVRFSSLKVDVAPDKKVSLQMQGEARSYNAIAFQSDVFSRVEYIKMPVFSNLVLDETGIITFNFASQIDPAAISYKKLYPGSVGGNDDAGAGANEGSNNGSGLPAESPNETPPPPGTNNGTSSSATSTATSSIPSGS